jgi:hypothetical protein
MDPNPPGYTPHELCKCECHNDEARPFGLNTTVIPGANWGYAPCVDCCATFFQSREENTSCTVCFEEFEKRQTDEGIAYNRRRMHECTMLARAAAEDEERSRTREEFVTTYEELALPLMDAVLCENTTGRYSMDTRRATESRRAICITTKEELGQEVKLAIQNLKDALFSESLRSSIEVRYFTSGVEFMSDDGGAESNARLEAAVENLKTQDTKLHDKVKNCIIS